MHREIERGDDVPWREKKGKRKAAEGKKTGGAKGGPTGASIEGKEGAPFALSRSHSFSPCPRERTRTHAPMPRAQRTLLSYHGRERLRRKKRRKRTNEEAETRSALSPFLLSSRGQAKSGATFFISFDFSLFFHFALSPAVAMRRRPPPPRLVPFLLLVATLLSAPACLSDAQPQALVRERREERERERERRHRPWCSFL